MNIVESAKETAKDTVEYFLGKPKMEEEIVEEAKQPPKKSSQEDIVAPHEYPAYEGATESILEEIPAKGETQTSTGQTKTNPGESKPLVVIIGSTGIQGRAVVKNLWRDGRFRIRTLLDDVNSKIAKKFSQRGIEILNGDLRNVNDLNRAFKGAQVTFVHLAYDNIENTKYNSLELEELGKRIAEEAKKCGVEHYIWNSEANAEKISGGKYKLPNFTSRAHVDKYIRNLGFPYYHILVPAFFYQNFATTLRPTREQGFLVWRLPMDENAYLLGVDARDIGRIVLKILQQPQLSNKKKIFLSGSRMHPDEYIVQLSLTTKIPAKVQLVSREEFLKHDFPNALETIELFQFMQEFRPSWESGNQFVPMTTWEQYVRSQMSPIISE